MFDLLLPCFARCRLAATLLAGITGVGACSAPAPADDAPPHHAPSPILAPGPIVRDSAGVRIIENPETAPDSTGWRIGAEPILVLGDDESRGDAYLFSFITGAVWLGDGSLVVADGTFREVRVYDEAGTFVRRIGRHGRGPGEFNNVSQLFLLPGDTLVVQSPYDGASAAVYTGTGEYLDNWSPPVFPADDAQRYSSSRIHGIFSDGSILATTYVRSRPRTELPQSVPIFSADTVRFRWIDAAGQTLADLGEHPLRRMLVYSRGRQPGFQWDWYLPQPRYLIRGMQLYTTDGDSFEIRVRSADGQLQQIIRKAHPPSPLAQSAADKEWNDMLGMVPDEMTWLRTVPRSPLPEQAPAIDQMLFDRLGNLWVRSKVPGDPLPAAWFVFDSTGELRHSLRSDLTPLQIADDRVLTVLRNEFGVPRIAIYPLFKD